MIQIISFFVRNIKGRLKVVKKKSISMEKGTISLIHPQQVGSIDEIKKDVT